MAIGRDEKIAMVVLAGFVGYVLLSGKSEKQRLETAVMENTKLNMQNWFGSQSVTKKSLTGSNKESQRLLETYLVKILGI